MAVTNEFEFYHADCKGNASNCSYPHNVLVRNAEDFLKLSKWDHVCSSYQNNYRCIDNFQYAKNREYDVDNEHTEVSKEWITKDDINQMLNGVPHIIVESRNHMKQKGEYSPRPRYHVIVECEPETDAEKFKIFNLKVLQYFPYFDENALDPARFFFATDSANVELYPGTITMNQLIVQMEEETDFDEGLETEPTIKEGSRNTTMHRYAVCILKRCGDTDEAYQKFMEKSERCEELSTIWNSAKKFYAVIRKQPEYVEPEEYNNDSPKWEEPIPFDEFSLPTFPTEALPLPIRNYVLAVSETTQTPVDMAATSALAIIAMCMQGKYFIQGKRDWVEPVNIFALNIAEPSERKSAVNSHMTKPVNRYEMEYNKIHSAAFETNKMRKRVLERRQRSVEDQVSKGKAEEGELLKIATEVAEFKELLPMQMYVDDITPEKLISVLADRDGTAAVVSAEGGIFDQIAGGMYSKATNIDVFLKGHAGDTIRVDRIGRNSESIEKPALTMLLSVQPNILAGMMQNSTFRGRGLTARFLYCFPSSHIGDRRYRSNPISEEAYRGYESIIKNLIDEDCNPTMEAPEVITLSSDADLALEQFANELEPKLKGEYADIADWAGKLVGVVLRISALLWRAGNERSMAFLGDEPDTVAGKDIVEHAILIGKYYTEHARAAYLLMGADPVIKQCKYVLNAVKNTGLVELTLRDIMRLCRSFRKAEDLQPVLDRLCEYGYFAPKQEQSKKSKGRPGSQKYLVNPSLYEL